MRGEGGGTLIELMVGITVATTIAAAAYTVASGSNKAANVNDQTAEMQLNARIAMDLITRDLKTAGFGMNGTIGGCTNAIIPADNNAGGADTGPDSVSLVVPTLVSTLTVQPNSLVVPTTLSLQTGSVAAQTGFGIGAIISVGGVWNNTVSGVATDVLTLATTISPTQVYPVGTQVFWLQCVTYAISTNTATCASQAPCLLRSGVPLADGIEDLQLAYACDGCLGAAVDSAIDDQPGSTAGYDARDFVSDNAWATSPMTPDTIRLVRVSIVARQSRADSNWSATGAVVAEDHNPSTDPGFNPSTYQQIRRRLYTRTVQVRNLGL
jgi:type IV pilus assembly protein PilW